MEAERIGILLGRKLAGEITPPEQEELNRLLERYPQEVDMDTYKKLQAGRLSEPGREDALGAAVVYWEKHRELMARPARVPRTAGATRWMVAIRLAAACITLLFLFLTWHLASRQQEAPVQAPKFVTVTTGKGEKKTLSLPEGTQVTLNENSRFVYDKHMTGKGSRHASLRGEAYFHVAHYPEAPFTVYTDKMEIKVLGTSFNVQAYRGDVAEATLFEGKIEVLLDKGPQGKRKVVLQPQEKLTVEGPQPPAVSPAEPLDTTLSRITQFTVSEIARPSGENLYKENAWVSGKVIFTDEPLAAIAAFLEEKHDVNVRFLDPSLGKKRLRGVFVDGSLESVLDALKFTVGFQYRIKDNEVLIF